MRDVGEKKGEGEDMGAQVGVLKVEEAERGDAGQWCGGRTRLQRRRRRRRGKAEEGEEDGGVYNVEGGCEGSTASSLDNDQYLSLLSSPYPSSPFLFASPMPFPTPPASPSPSASLSPLSSCAPPQHLFAPSSAPCVHSLVPPLHFDRH